MTQWRKITHPPAAGTSASQGIVSAACLLLWTLALMLSATGQNAMASAASAGDAATKSAKTLEYEVKAAFIFNFMRFIDWPQEKLITNQQYQKDNEPNGINEKTPPPPIIIGIVGNSPFGEAFKPILNRKIGDRTVRLVEFDSFGPYLRTANHETGALQTYRRKNGALLARCDMLFFCASESRHYEKLLPLTVGTAAVTVSDIPDFAVRGGMIGFVMDNDRIRFDIQLDSAEREKIKIRSQLLELARRVHKKSDSND